MKKNYYENRTARWYIVTSVLLKPRKHCRINVTSIRHSKPLYAPSVPFKPLYALSVPFKPLFAPSVPFKPLYAPSVPFKPLYAPSVPFKPLYVPSVPFKPTNNFGSVFTSYLDRGIYETKLPSHVSFFLFSVSPITLNVPWTWFVAVAIVSLYQTL